MEEYETLLKGYTQTISLLTCRIERRGNGVNGEHPSEFNVTVPILNKQEVNSTIVPIVCVVFGLLA